MRKGKRIGYGLLSLLPLLIMAAVQFLALPVIDVVIAASISMPPETAPALIEEAYNAFVTQHYTEILMVIQIATLIVVGCWYYLAFIRRKERTASGKLLSFQSLAGIFLLAIGYYFFISILLYAADFLVPDMMAEYNMLMEEAGIEDLSLFSTIATLILAPLEEELIFRGLILRYLRKAGVCFWAANLIQAVLFGIAHWNWIQGIYAFLLGLILGYLYHRFHTLAAPMLFHMLFNFAGTYVAAWLELLPETIWLYIALAAAALALALPGIKLLRKPTL